MFENEEPRGIRGQYYPPIDTCVKLPSVLCSIFISFSFFVSFRIFLSLVKENSSSCSYTTKLTKVSHNTYRTEFWSIHCTRYLEHPAMLALWSDASVSVKCEIDANGLKHTIGVYFKRSVSCKISTTLSSLISYACTKYLVVSAHILDSISKFANTVAIVVCRCDFIKPSTTRYIYRMRKYFLR